MLTKFLKNQLMEIDKELRSDPIRSPRKRRLSADSSTINKSKKDEEGFFKRIKRCLF